MFKFKNNAKSLMAAAIASGDLVFSVTGGDGALFPASGNFRVTLVKATGVREIVEVESRSTDAFTIMTAGRGLEGTTPQTYSAGDVTAGVVVRLSLTQGVLESFVQVESGTRMLFQQTTAPSGWTKETNAAYDDAALRVVTGAVGTAGADAFTAVFGAGKATNGFTLTTNEIPSHNHGGVTGGQSVTHTHPYNTVSGTPGGDGASPMAGYNTSPGTTGNASIDHTHTVAAQGGGAEHAHDMTMNIKYADLIVATKD